MSEDIYCNAIDNTEICGDKVVGQSYDKKKRYCERHVPSQAIIGGRINKVRFGVREDE